MQELFQLVAELLAQHTCVIVPELGGFVSNEKSAVIDNQTGRFCPPSVEILFNSHLVHNDGLLTQAVAECKGISFDVAAKLVSDTVCDIKRDLTSKGRSEQPGFGTFFKSVNTIVFIPEENKVSCLDSFGLPVFSFPELNQIEEVKNEKITAVRHTLVGATVAAAVFGAVAILPVNKNEMQQQSASFAPATCSENTNMVAETEKIHEQPQMEETEVVEETTETENAVDVADVHSEEVQHEYHLVLTKFDTEKQAADFIAKHQPRLSDKLEVVELADDFAVTCARTEDLDMANKMLQHVQKNSSFKKSFILYR